MCHELVVGNKRSGFEKGTEETVSQVCLGQPSWEEPKLEYQTDAQAGSEEAL